MQGERICSAEEWREDLRALADAMQAQHPDLFFALSRTAFDRAVERLHQRIPGLTDAQIAFHVAELVAMVSAHGRDGHTTLGIRELQRILPLCYYPLQLYWFGEGIFIVDGLGPHQEFVGSRILDIDGVAVETACQLVDPIVARDNAWTVRARMPWVLTLAEFLHVAGVAAKNDRAIWRLETLAGTRHSLSLTPVPADQYWAWVVQRAARNCAGLPKNPDGPLYLRDNREAFWMTFLADSRTLYVQYNAVRPQTQSGESLAAFAARLSRRASEHDVARLVIDLRQNDGGDNTTYGPLLRALREPAIDQPGRLFALIGRHTFSAAGNFVTELERFTGAILVGEPTGGSPNQYGDVQPITLPHSGIVVLVSTTYHVKSDPPDARLWVAPHRLVEPMADDYFAGKDRTLAQTLMGT